MVSRETLKLSPNQDAPRVKEAKAMVTEALGELDQTLVPFAMRLIEDHRTWWNTKRR